MNTELLPTLTAQIVAGFVSHNDTRPDELPGLISQVGASISSLGQPPEPEHVPAVDPKKSVFPDRLISLIDGKPYKMLKRHLGLHGFTPDSYREAFGLRPDYPMVADEYRKRRAQIAKDIGLGHHPKAARGRKAV